MIDGTSALQLHTLPCPVLTKNQPSEEIWTAQQHYTIVQKLLKYRCAYVRGRDEYTLLKEFAVSGSLTEESDFRQTENSANAENIRAEGSGVISPLCDAIMANDTGTTSYSKPFLAPVDVQKNESIANVIPSFRAIQSESMSINIGFDTEFQDYSLPQYREIMQKISEKESEIDLLDSHKAEAAAELELLHEEQAEYLAQAMEAREEIEEELTAVRKELSASLIGREVAAAVEKEVRAEIKHTDGQVVPSRSLLEKTSYVKVPEDLWKKILSAFTMAVRQSKMIRKLTDQVQAFRTRVSELVLSMRYQ